MKVAVLGAGAYGLAMALMLNENKHQVVVYTKFSKELENLKKYQGNPQLLPNVKLSNNIIFTDNLEKCVTDSKLIFIMVPAGAVDDIASDLVTFYQDQHLCIGSKGIEQDTCLFVDDVVKKYLKTEKIAVISGPSFAVDIASYVPIGLTVASHDKETSKFIKKTLSNKYLKIRTCQDVIGLEICGSIKNIIAIACGMLDGMELPESTKAMLIVEAMHDIKELIDALGGDKKTILSYGGIGDLILTCTSEKSRNFRFGQLLGKRVDHELIEEYLNNHTVEGYYTLKSIYSLLRNKQVKMPIIDIMYDIIVHGDDINKLKNFLIEKD